MACGGLFVGDLSEIGKDDPNSRNGIMPIAGPKAEVGRTEKAATRRNKTFNYLMSADIKEIDRAMKISIRQLDLQRKDLYVEIDSLESRSGWLRDIEKQAVPANLLHRRSRTTINRNSNSNNNRAQSTNRRNRLRSEQSESDTDDSSQRPEFFRSHTEMPSSIRKGVSNNHNRASSSTGSKFNSQVHFSKDAVDDLDGQRSPEASVLILGDTSARDDDESTSPAQSMLSNRQQSSPQQRSESTSTSNSVRRSSLFMIQPEKPSRYKLLDVPLKQIDVRKIKEHARASQKLRFEGRHMLEKRSSKSHEIGGCIDTGTEYVPKRVKMMREERLRIRRIGQEHYNKNALESAVAKFKEMYIVPSGSGLTDVSEFFAGLKA